MPKRPRNRTLTAGARHTRLRHRHRATANEARHTGDSLGRDATGGAEACEAAVTGVIVLPMPSFLDDARGMLTDLQMEELKRRVLRDRGDVLYEHGTARLRNIQFHPFRVWVLDYWEICEVWLIGLQPLGDGDDPKPPTVKGRGAIRRLLDKAGAIAVYELLKKLRDLIGLRNFDTIAFAGTQNSGTRTLRREPLKGEQLSDHAPTVPVDIEARYAHILSEYLLALDMSGSSYIDTREHWLECATDDYDESAFIYCANGQNGSFITELANGDPFISLHARIRSCEDLHRVLRTMRT